jgi:transcriptional regulator with XRE-family HTH domain
MAAKRKENLAQAKAIGSRLEYAIRTSQVSRAALSRKSGVRADAIGRLEQGRRVPGLPALKRLAEALGVPAGWFVFGELPLPDIPLAAPEDRDRRLRSTVEADSRPA